MSRLPILGVLALTLLAAGPAPAAEPATEEADSALSAEVEALEEELLFPSSTQVQFFLSLDVGTFFSLDSVKLELDGKQVAAHLYTPRELDALRRGAVQRLHTANLGRGEHELVAVFTGKGPNGRDYRRAASLDLDKGLGPKYVELRIRDTEARQQPEFDIREWE